MGIDENFAVSAFITAPHFRINKKIMKVYGLDVALFIADIFSRWNYFREEGKLDENGFFYVTKPEITESTGIKKDKQVAITKLLCEEGILEIERRGLPRRNWYKINIINLAKKLEEKSNNHTENNLTARRHNKYNKNKYTFSLSKDNKLSLSKEKEASGEAFSKENLEKVKNKRCLLKKISLNSFTEKKETLSPKRKIPSYLETQQENVKRLFCFWNSLSPPLVKHKDNTKTTERICKILREKLQKYAENDIKLAIRTYAQLLNDSNNCVSRNSLKLPGYRVGLDEFFGFSNRTKRRMELSNVNLSIKSWFHECFKKDPSKKYALFLDDEYPVVTAVLKEEWVKRKKTNSFSVKEENCFRLAAKKIVNFINKNKDNYTFTPTEINLPQHCVPYLFEALESDNKLHEASISWLCSDVMFNHQLPRYFSKIGMSLCQDL